MSSMPQQNNARDKELGRHAVSFSVGGENMKREDVWRNAAHTHSLDVRLAVLLCFNFTVCHPICHSVINVHLHAVRTESMGCSNCIKNEWPTMINGYVQEQLQTHRESSPKRHRVPPQSQNVNRLKGMIISQNAVVSILPAHSTFSLLSLFF